MDDEEQQAGERDKRLRELEDLRWLMQHPPGRRIVTRIFAQTGQSRTSFAIDMATMAFREGERNIGLWLKSEIDTAAPNGYLQMIREFGNG